ncbi:MAG: SMC-Scp complex subunit ScpB [Gammaproteobacteria bacterium]|nr:SMC-Scp complex subunit ScpB [Gammaproteobacteria bacterium]
MTPEKLKSIIEAALFASERALSADRILGLFHVDEVPTKQAVQDALETLQAECEERGLELIEVSSGYRYQVRQTYGEWINRMFEERAPRYSRALLETLALICYKQPITRAEVEDVRGVAVSTNIMRTLLDRDWIKLVGHRDVPGKPAIYGTTGKLLDDLSIKRLDELPPLADIRDIDQIPGELNLFLKEESADSSNDSSDGSNADGSIAVASLSMVEGDEIDTNNEVEHLGDDNEDNLVDADTVDLENIGEGVEEGESQDASAESDQDVVLAEDESEPVLNQAISS